jgi:calcium-translocating P-type ATPase
MLWAAAGLALLGRLPELAIAIVVVIVLNALFAFAQERRADRAAERLRALLPQRVSVLRDGARVEVDAADVVLGDVVVLEAGARVPADARILQAAALLVDTSLLTGESEPSPVATGDVFAGCFVVEGEARAVVTAIGADTRLGRIAALTVAGPSPPSPLTNELRRVVHVIALIAVSIGGAFFGLAMLLGDSATDGFVFAVGVTVALVPEALLPTVTLSLAWGAEQMAKRRVLVRSLDAVQTLGSTTFICTDKTGTLTRNQMTVVRAWTPVAEARTAVAGYEPDAAVTTTGDVEVLRRVALAGVRCSTGRAQLVDGTWYARGDPMEAALDVFARRLGIDTDADRAAQPVVARFPFDPRRRRMSAVVGDQVLVKGAPSSVLPLCRGPAPAIVDRFTADGLRVLAVAGRCTGGAVPATAADAERDLELYGIVALQDPPRDDVLDALTACRAAGIRVAMITGDHPATATAIATDVGLRTEGDPVLIGDDLPDDLAVLGALIDRDGVVVARVSPEDKLRIAQALHARGHVVAMTGDGVNDGPALHEADIGIAMGASGTDVAREAADLVLLDDHFASIVVGVEQGRAAFVNIRRFLTYHLTDNVAELTPFVLWAMSGGRFPLALGVLQILALDIGTDTFSAVALGAEPPSPHLLDGPPVRGRLLNHTVAHRAFAVLGPTEAIAAVVAFVGAFLVSGWRPGDTFPGGHVAAAASGTAFLTVVFGQVANAFACRSSTHRVTAAGWSRNRMLVVAATFGLSLSLLTVTVGPIARELDQAIPPGPGWLLAMAAAPVLLLVDALDKRRRRRHRGDQADSSVSE